MSQIVAGFPGEIWDGSSETRTDMIKDAAPDYQDYDRIVAEMIATQTYIAALGLGDGGGFIELTNVSAPTPGTDSFAMYATDQTAGNAAPTFKTENGQIVKLFTSAFIADPTGGTPDAEARTAINAILDILIATGLMAAA